MDKKGIETSIAFICAIAIALVLWTMGLDKQIAGSLSQLGVAGAFLVGLFYTVGLTTPTAMVVVLDMMTLGNAFQTAFAAAIGAAIMDASLFLLFRKTLEENAGQTMKRLRGRLGKIQFLAPFAGFFVFGLPLPDELGLALMELTYISPARLAVIVFAAKLFTLLIIWTTLHA